MGEVIELDIETQADVRVDKILADAAAREFASVVVIGVEADGKLTTYTSDASLAKNIWHIEIAKKRLLEESDS